MAWVALGTGPILKVAINHDMHLIYAMAPVAMIFAESMRGWRWRSALAIPFLWLPLGDQALNYWNSSTAQNTIMAVHNKMIPALQSLPGNESNVVLCNFFDCTELINPSGPPRFLWTNKDGPLAHDPRFPTLFDPALQVEAIQSARAKGGRSYYLIQQEPQFNGEHHLPDIPLLERLTFEANIVQIYLDPLHGLIAQDTYQRFLAYTDWVHSFGFVSSRRLLGLVNETHVVWKLYSAE